MDNEKNKNWTSFIHSVQAIAQSGLAYAENPYEKERYEQLIDLASKMYSKLTKLDLSQIKKALQTEEGYITPKICVRGLCLENDNILLVKETANDRWSLPGGWADVGLSAAENMQKEMKEETGFDCDIKRLLAFWDKEKHEHPPHWPHTYIACFLCEKISGEKKLSHEISAIDFFPLDKLPTLCTHRVTKNQIQRLIEISKRDLATDFD